MSFYEKYILPFAIDCVCGGTPFTNERKKIVPLAEGRVLEIGLGSGLNLPHYKPEKITMFWGLEPSDGMRKKAFYRMSQAPFTVHLLDLPGEAIPLENNSVDTIVMTYSLCTIPDAMAALQQMKRVLKPGGKLLFAEHGLAPDESIRKWQNRINPIWKKFAGGCNLNRPIAEMIQEAGFKIVQLDIGYLPHVNRIAGFHFCGIAVG